MIKFESISQLRNWLEMNGVDLECWGQGDSKSVEDLWQEITSGETQIQENPPLRVVHVVNIIVRNGDKILVEGSQKIARNQVRYRGLPPAEKIKPGEGYIDAAIRGLKEELQINPDRIRIISSGDEPQSSIHESQSYPGLRSQYIIYNVEVKIDNLPDNDFWTNERNIGDPVRQHHWKWEPLE